MKLVEIKGQKLADGGEMTANEQYTFEHYLKQFIEHEFSDMSFKEAYDILVNPKNDESTTFFVTGVISEVMGYSVDYNEDNWEEVEWYLDNTYYDFCVNYLKKLATAKYGNKFSTMKGYKTAVYGRKPKRNNIMQLENSVRRMF